MDLEGGGAGGTFPFRIGKSVIQVMGLAGLRGLQKISGKLTIARRIAAWVITESSNDAK